MMLAFLSANIVDAAATGGTTSEQLAQINARPIGEWEEFWKNRATPPASFTALQNLPQSRVAAGFELFARKPR